MTMLISIVIVKLFTVVLAGFNPPPPLENGDTTTLNILLHEAFYDYQLSNFDKLWPRSSGKLPGFIQTTFSSTWQLSIKLLCPFSKDYFCSLILCYVLGVCFRRFCVQIITATKQEVDDGRLGMTGPFVWMVSVCCLRLLFTPNHAWTNTLTLGVPLDLMVPLDCRL